MSWHAYVYCHKNKGNNYTTIENRTLYHGQLIYFRNNGDGKGYIRDYAANIFYHAFNHKGTKVEGLPIKAGYGDSNGNIIYGISEFNKRVYGDNHAHAGGSHYGVRKDVKLYNSDGTWNRTLPSIYRIIIGAGQGYTTNNNLLASNFSMLRCWGYKTNTGLVIETSGLYVLNDVTLLPQNYTLNTK